MELSSVNFDIIGIMVTCGAAIFSWWQARKAKKYRNQIKSRIQTITLVKLVSEAKIARDECLKLGTEYTERMRYTKRMRGVDDKEIVSKILCFSNQLHECNYRLSKSESNGGRSADLQQLIKDYNNTSDTDKQREVATQMYDEILLIIASLSKQIDQNV